MYGEDDKYENVEPSTIKKSIEAWFEGKSTNYWGDLDGSVNPDYTDLTKYEESFLEDAVWCNDRTEGSVSGGYHYYAGYDRAKSYSPSLACERDDSFTKSSGNGNGKSNHKVGMISVDELTIGGLNYNSSSSNINTYLYTGSSSAYWWSLSPDGWFGGNASVFRVVDDLDVNVVNVSRGVRPMISLQHSVEIETSGNGTTGNPYKVITDGVKSGKKLYDTMISSAKEIVSDANVDFSQQPTNDDATKLFEYTGEITQYGYPIYYYRGPVTNNNVIFGGYCWKIVRTTETGGIKLIYSGKPTSDGKCTATGEEQLAFKSIFNVDFGYKKNFGYVYGENDSPYENKHDSVIKKNIEAWFEGKNTNVTGDPDGSVNPDYTDLTQYEESFLEDAVWCNDRTEGSVSVGVSGSAQYYAGYDRNTTDDGHIPNPNLTCPSNDSFTVSIENGNGALGESGHKVGMITVDELTMGGLNYSTRSSNVNTYLYTGSNAWWWTISPGYWYNLSCYVTIAYYGLSFSDVDFRYGNGVRPMVSLVHDIKTYTGDGTAESPYVIVDNYYDNMQSAGTINATANTDYIHFDGVDDYWSLGLENYDFSDGFTMSIRFKLNEYKDSTQYILGNWQAGGGGLSITQTNNIYFQWYVAGGYKTISGPEIELNEWYTVTATYEDGLFSLYVYNDALENGRVFITSSSYPGEFKNPGMPMTIGANPNLINLTEFANIDVREAAIYNRALSSEEIAKGFKEDINIKAVSDDKLLKYVDYKYMKFDGVDDYATMGLEDYDFSDGFTWGIKFKLNEYKTTNQNIFGNLDTSGGTINISNYENALHGLFYIDGEYRTVVGEAPKLNRWYTVTYTYEKEKNLFSLYVDGKPVKTLEYPGTLVNSSQPFMIGANPNIGTHSEFANIDVRQAVIYSRALQEQEIKDTLSDEIKVINDDKLLRYVNFSE